MNDACSCCQVNTTVRFFFTTGSRTAELTPSGSINVCPGEEISIKCTELETTKRTLNWIITPQNKSIGNIQLS